MVVGGQFGSEGKGKIAAFITQKEEIDLCIRCGGPNSGHSFIDRDGSKYLVRQVPTGFVRPETRLLIPAGGLVDPSVLRAEIDTLRLADRVGVDYNAMIIEDSDREHEGHIKLRERLSSTLCGVGSAVSRRALRGPDVRLAKDAARTNPWLARLLTDVSSEANHAVDNGSKVLIEGTQGFGLSLYHTPEFPKATSRDTTAAGFACEVGISPRLVEHVVLVFRTFPIRVAGIQAGRLKEEITWAQLQIESGCPYPITETTSVTQRLRRIGRFEWDLAASAVRINRPTVLAINGLDYLDYRNKGVTDIEQLTPAAIEFLSTLELRFGVPVAYWAAGPQLQDCSTEPVSGKTACSL